MWQKGFLAWIVKVDAVVIELAVTTFKASPKRLQKFGKTKDKTWIARLVRFVLCYEDSAIAKYYEDVEEGT